MPIFLSTGFNDETIGTVPSNDVGTWSVVNDVTVELWENMFVGHPSYFETQTLEFNPTAILNAKADYDFPYGGTTTGYVYGNIAISTDLANGSGFEIVYGQVSPDLSIAHFNINTSGYMETVLPDGSTELLYTPSGFPNNPATITTPIGQEYTYFYTKINMDNKTYILENKGNILGYNNNGVYTTNIPFRHSTAAICNTIYLNKESGTTWAANVLWISITGGDNVIANPDKFTLISPFELDNTTVTSSYYYENSSGPGPINTTPNEKSVYTSGQNVLKEAASLKWESKDTDFGSHRLLFDFGAGNTEELGYIGLFNHNFDEVSSPDTGTIGHIYIVAGDVLADLWTQPDLLIDVSTQQFLDPISGFLPDHTARRYYGIEIAIAWGSLSSIDNLSIGRVAGATASQIWTPNIDPSIDYKWADIDQSFTRQLKNNTLFYREKSNRRKFDVRWNFLEAPDQETLRTLWREAGGHSQYICMLDPDDRPQTYTILCYIGGNALVLNRKCHKGAGLALSFDEVVE